MTTATVLIIHRQAASSRMVWKGCSSLLPTLPMQDDLQKREHEQCSRSFLFSELPHNHLRYDPFRYQPTGITNRTCENSPHSHCVRYDETSYKTYDKIPHFLPPTLQNPTLTPSLLPFFWITRSPSHQSLALCPLH